MEMESGTKLPSFEQYLYDNGYSRQEQISFRECGPDKKARISAILGIMAVFGGFDYDARGLTHDRLLEMREVFLLSRAVMHIHRHPVDRDVLTIRTWEDGIRGAHMRRVYRMYGADGQILVSAKTDWILVDPVSRKILRPASFTAKTLDRCPVEIDCPEPKKIRFDPAAAGNPDMSGAKNPDMSGASDPNAASDLGKHIVAWSDLDGNGHLFSGRYADIVWNALPPELRRRPVETFAVNYSKEAVPGEILTLSGYMMPQQPDTIPGDEIPGDTIPGQNTYVMAGNGPDGVCFLAEITFASME